MGRGLDDGAGEDLPGAGSPVTLLPVRAEGLWVGEVRSWLASPSGLVVTSDVATTAEAVRVLGGQRVWVTARTARTDTLVVFEAVAQASPGRADQLTLNGVVTVAQERRRQVVRAPAEHGVQVILGSSGESMRLRTVDLSRNGCRVSLPPGRRLEPAETVRLVLDLDERSSVTLTGEVLRVDDRQGQAVLRFLEVEPDVGERLERLVYSRLVPSRSAG